MSTFVAQDCKSAPGDLQPFVAYATKGCSIVLWFFAQPSRKITFVARVSARGMAHGVISRPSPSAFPFFPQTPVPRPGRLLRHSCQSGVHPGGALMEKILEGNDLFGIGGGRDGH